MDNKRSEAIMEWLKKHRPDLAPMIKLILEDPFVEKPNQAFALLLDIGFEAGRQFQADNVGLELDNPNVY
ncbi:MAG: hypothetical protein KBC81_02625 [Candidatus Pacebacteria bacterium]|nr:hypothetical protein [Candidatus Paceibacterota bacterium]